MELTSTHTTYNRRGKPISEDDAIAYAIRLMRGVDVPMPVIHRNRCVAHVMGSPWWAPDPSIVYWRRPAPGEKLWLGYATYDDVISELSTAGKRYTCNWNKTHTTAPVAGNYSDMWPCGGAPTAGTYPGAAHTAVQKDQTSTGAIWHDGDKSPDTKHLLYGYNIGTAGAPPPSLFLYDRVLCYEACAYNANSNQVLTNVAAAQRYIGAGEGGLKGMATVQTVNGATANNWTQLRYTDQDGNTLQVMPQTPVPAAIVSGAAPTATLGARVIFPATTAATLPWGPFIPMATGDGGMHLINDYTTSAANTGTFTLTLMRPLAVFPGAPLAGIANDFDLVQRVAGLERIRDGACLAFYAFTPAATAFTGGAQFDVGWG